MATYVNDLRLKEIATGDESGTWGTSTNTNLELIGEALGYATEGITTNADTHATTVADGSTDPGRAMYIKYTGTLDSACTITIGPNTMTRVHIIENATSGSQNIIIKQGSGAEVTIPNGFVKAVYLDGAGSGAAVVEAFDNLSVGTNFRIGNGAAEDTTLIFDGNAQDFYIGLDDSTDDLVFGKGSTLGTTQAMAIDENMDVAFGPTTNVTITNDGNEDTLTLVSTDADASVGPNLVLYRNSSSPADSDLLGQIKIVGRNDNSQDVVAFQMQNYMTDVSDGTEDASVYFYVMAGGAVRERIGLGPTAIVINEDSQDVDFRIESDNNANMLFVDAGNDHVNFGTSTDYGGVVNIESTDNNYTLMLASTDGDANAGPWLGFDRVSSSPAADDNVGSMAFVGRDSGGNQTTYGEIRSYINDPTDGSEDGRFKLSLMSGGTVRSLLDISGSNAIVFNEDSQDIDFRIESNGDDAVFFIDAGNDRVILGHDSARTNYYNGSLGSALQIETHATANRYVSIGATVNSDDANGAYLILATSRGTAANSTTICENGDFFGSLSFQGGDGNQLVEGASIAGQCDGTPGANDMPGSLQFRTTADGQSTVTEHMRIGHTGMVSMGTTGQNGGGWTERLQVAGNSVRSNVAFFTGFGGSAVTGFSSGNSTNAVNFLLFYNYNDTAVGSIQISNAATGTSVSFNTTSDYRLKENVEYDWDGLTRLKQLKPARFTWKADDSGTVVDGFIAHEAQQVVPESVTGTYNETEDVTDAVLNSIGNVIDEGISEDDWKAGKNPILWTEDDLNIPDGVSVGDVKTEAKYAADTTWKNKHTKDKYQGIDQSKLVPLLVKAVQEQQTLLETLETKVKALESG